MQRRVWHADKDAEVDVGERGEEAVGSRFGDSLHKAYLHLPRWCGWLFPAGKQSPMQLEECGGRSGRTCRQRMAS